LLFPHLVLGEGHAAHVVQIAHNVEDVVNDTAAAAVGAALELGQRLGVGALALRQGTKQQRRERER
jgi:hypothetical protein